MKLTRRILPLLFLSMITSYGFSQQAPDFLCGFDDLRSPEQTKQIQAFEEQLQGYFSEKKNAVALEQAKPGAPFIVPVVVHIIHDGGSENIPDAQILKAIDHLNEGFAAQGYYAQQGATVNTEIQFCMATRDPDGYASNGITRTQSPLTNMSMELDDLPTKNLSRWKTTEYVNIWVVKEIVSLSLGPGVAGYAYFPGAHGSPVDGMICEARFFGTNPGNDAVLIHEMGHYFGLYHTFEGGCLNDNCVVDGDKVCDTPPDQAKHTTCPYNSCNTDVAPGSPFSSDIDDYTGNFLDYSPFSCFNFFTVGQRTRMHGALETSRMSLLTSKGCSTPCTMPVTAAFTVTPNPAFAGQTVTLTNNSTGASNFSWSENGVVFSQNQNETRTFNTVGNILLTLQVTNSDPNCEASAQVIVPVQCPIVANFTVSQYEINPGETLTFVNTSSGLPNNYEWSVNGFPVGTTTDFSFLFSNPGYYSVRLQAGNGACSNEKVIQIHVKPICGGEAYAEHRYNADNFYTVTADMVPLPDGSLIFCGLVFQVPMVGRLDATGAVMWYKLLNTKGRINDIEPLPDGTFMLSGSYKDQLVLIKIDDGGNILWLQTLQNPLSFVNAEFSLNCLAANPDGSVIFYFRGLSGSGAIGKISGTGAVLWMNQYQILNGMGGLRLSNDGSGDILVSSQVAGGPGNVSIVVRIDQSGLLKTIYRYHLPQQEFYGYTHTNLGVHPNGDFSLIFSGQDGFPPISNDNYFIRCQSNGQPIIAKKFGTIGADAIKNNARYLPGDGWLICENKSAVAGNYLLRINEQNEYVWQRKIGGGGAFFSGDVAMAFMKQNGMLKAIVNTEIGDEFRLLHLQDSYSALNCLPDVPFQELVTDIPVVKTEISSAVTQLALSFLPETYEVIDVAVDRLKYCATLDTCPEFCDNQLDDDGDGYVDCFDSDCACGDTTDNCTIPSPDNHPIMGKTQWESAHYQADILAVPIVGNLNPSVDDIPEIIIRVGNDVDSLLIFKGDGSNKTKPVVFLPTAKLHAKSEVTPIIADINADGSPELILVTQNNRIQIYKNYQEDQSQPFEFWFENSVPFSFSPVQLSLADFDSNGIPELFVGNRILSLDFSNPASPDIVLKLVGSGQSGAPSDVSVATIYFSTAADVLTPTDCNGDPDCNGLELVAGSNIYSIDLDLSDGDGIEIKIQRDLNVLNPGQSYQDGATQVADMDLDGVPDIVVNGPKGTQNQQVSGLYVWNKNGLLRFFPYNTTQTQFEHTRLTISNVFDDKIAGFAQDFPEIIGKGCIQKEIIAWNIHASQNNPSNPSWWRVPSDDVSCRTFQIAFDFDSDGFDEIISRGEGGLKVLYGGALPFPAGVNSSTREWFNLTDGSPTLLEGPIVADVDGDGQAEIAYTCKPANAPTTIFRGLLRVLESANGPWPAARPIWNQFNYFGVNINDDLSIPKNQQKHWLEFGGIGSGKRPFNKHLAQVSSLNPFDSNQIKVPDASITLDSTRCHGDSIEVFLNLCNLGSALLPGSTPIAFYDGDPTVTAAPLLFPPLLTNESIGKGACKNIKLVIPATYNTSIFIVVNDDGSLPVPFSLSTDFPSGNQPECHYENNMASFSIQNQTPPLDLGPDLLICNNSVLQLSVNPNFQRYRWQDGSDSPTFTAFSPGKYWVDAFDACGVVQSDTIQIQLNTLNHLDLPDELAFCAGEMIQLSAPGFLKYNWLPADSVSCFNCAAVDILASKSFTIQLTAATGDCFVSDSVRILVHPKPIVQLLAQDGDCTTSASITPLVNGAGPFDFLWSDLSADSILNVSQSGTYVLDISDKFGCQASDSAAVVNFNTLAISANTISVTCANGNNASIDLNILGGTGPFQYLWSNNETSEDLTNIAAGPYSVVTTDANGCTISDSFVLADPPAIQLTLDKMEPKCAGEATGAFNLTASGGTGNLIFSWSNNLTLEDPDNLPSGTYSLLTTDANGCTATISDTLIDPPALGLSLQASHPTCAGESTGMLGLTAIGGTGTLTFLWSNNSMTQSLNNVPAGAYSVSITDANGCNATISETLINPPALALSLQIKDPKCAGEATGALDLTTSGGTGSLSFLWSNNAQVEDPGNLSAGAYTVLTTDANGCTATLSAMLTDPPALQVGLQTKAPDCAGAATGTIDLTASGGTGILQFLWSNGTSSEDLNLVTGGAYTVKTTDENACTATASLILTDPPELVVQLQSSNLNCPGDLGTIDLNAQGGTLPWTFLWSNGATTEDLSISQSGTYTATVTDFNACQAIVVASVATIGIQPELTLQTDTLTCQKNSGVISVNADLPNTTYSWSGPNGFNSNLLMPSVNNSGEYTVIATGPFGGCTSVGHVFVLVDTLAPTILIPSHSAEIPCGLDSISLSAAGTSSGPGYATVWSSVNGGLILSGENTLFPWVGSGGVYELLVSNLANGCTVTDAIEVVQASAPIGVVTADPVRCFGEMNGAIRVVSGSGGTPPYRYSIDNQIFNLDSNFENLTAGIYPVFIRDVNGCTYSTEIEVTEPELLSIELIGDTLVVPGEISYLSAIIFPSGITAAQIEWWANGQRFVNDQLVYEAQLSQNTEFQITIADANGCSTSDNLWVQIEESKEVFAPNIIFPESSIESNQSFMLFAGYGVIKIESLSIFDRWGTLLFSKNNFLPNDVREGWNGDYRDKPVNPGVYVWVASVVYKDGETKVLKGDFTVIR